ncbi:PD-(D/E)XK nuclease family protein [Arcobacter sp. FWKO B]|uniref:PD-(D/E)XK nuclease family protein n=1 Tax=Arcobacter sp. FWKO B TaxID=2593672 RepID=UPI0018A68B5E|nr:PD-(D/E)XK nuclease family protein [Arcobacter sp. FWKO B]QOG12618.1 Dna2/Cas4 domain-containing protein [Arcobacter sp. FWKO B]
MQNDLIVFPTSRAIRDYISGFVDIHGFLPYLTTMGEFFKNSIIIPNKTFIDDEKRFLLLSQASKEIDLQKLAISKNFTTFLKQSEYIFRFFDELSSEMVDIEQLKVVDVYEEYIEHLSILQMLLYKYNELLDLHNLVDKTNLANNYKINTIFLSTFDKITINVYGYMTKFEIKLIKEISKLVQINLIFETNSYNIKYLKTIDFSNFDIQSNMKINYDVTNKSIVSSQINNINNNNTIIKGFSTRIDQIAFVKKSIYDMVEKKRILPQNIVVITPDESFAQVLKVFDDEKYFNFAGGIPITQTLFFKKLNAIMEYLSKSDYKSIQKLRFYNIDLQVLNKEILPFLNKQIQSVQLQLLFQLLNLDDLDNELKNKLNDSIYKMDVLFFKSNEKITLAQGLKLLFDNISLLSLDDVAGGKITVMGLLESRGVRYEGVIIVDFNDDIAPKVSVKDKFLSTHIKELASLPTHIDRENLQKYYYKMVCDGAQELYISYVDNDQAKISRFASEIFDTLPIGLNDEEYKHILYSSKQIESKESEYLIDINLATQKFSATSLKDYLECKRRYYFKHIQKIKEHNISLMPKGGEVGTLIHTLLQNLFTNNKYFSTQDDFDKALFSEFNIIKNSIKHPSLKLELQIWEKKLRFLSALEMRRIKEGFQVAFLEKGFNINHKGINLTGKIDRVDIKDGKFYILDYKTSQSLKIDTLKTYATSSDFQLEFYFLALKDSGVEEVSYYDLNKIKILKEEVLDEKLNLLDTILESLYTTTVDFCKTDKLSNCLYCTYKIACGRE